MTHYVKIVHGTDARKLRQVNHTSPSLKSRIEPPPRSLGKNRNSVLVRPAKQYIHVITIRDQYILPRAALQNIIPFTAGQSIVSFSAEYPVVAIATGHRVVPARGSAKQYIVTAFPFQYVVLTISGQRVVIPASGNVLDAGQRVPLGITESDRVSGMQAHQDSDRGILVRSSIRPRPAVEHVSARAAVERVVAVTAIEYVIARTAMSVSSPALPLTVSLPPRASITSSLVRPSTVSSPEVTVKLAASGRSKVTDTQ